MPALDVISKASALFWVGCVLTSCAGSKPDERPLLVSEVINSHEHLADHKVLVRGYLVVNFEDINIYESVASHEAQDDQCITVGVTKYFQHNARAFNHKMVILRASLKSDYVKQGEICLSCCTKYALLPQEFSISK